MKTPKLDDDVFKDNKILIWSTVQEYRSTAQIMHASVSHEGKYRPLCGVSKKLLGNSNFSFFSDGISKTFCGRCCKSIGKQFRAWKVRNSIKT